MKRILLIITLILSTSLNIAAQEIPVASEVEEVEGEEQNKQVHPNWSSSFKEAVSKAKNKKKPILIYFTGSDWCGPCKAIDKGLFRTEEFIKYADKNIVLYKADFPNNKDLVTPENRETNKELRKRYRQELYPTMIVINDKGEVLGIKSGYYMIDSYYDFLKMATRNYK